MITQFKQYFLDNQLVIDKFIDVTAPYARLFDKANIIIFNSYNIDDFVTENKPKYTA